MIVRELLYPWHPWFAHRVAVHEAIGKSNDLVFRCTLSGSDADRSVEVIHRMIENPVYGGASNVPTSRHHGAPKHGDALL